ncbi:MAG: GlxA family transcriptional regulator [Parvularculaceae bacterium]
MTTKRSIAVLLFDRVNALDVAGPLEAFTTAADDGGAPLYDVETWAFADLAVRAESGLGLVADRPAPPSRKAHTLLVPGGAGAREPETRSRIGGWLKANARRFERVVSVCTGAYPLAASGLVDGRRLATHWAFAEDLQKSYPRVRVAPDALFLNDGRFHSSGGVAAGVDLALDLIAGDFGGRCAMDVARRMVVFFRRSGAQTQFSAPLKMQMGAPSRLAETCAWITNNLDKDLSVEALAARAGVSSRQFSRRFKDAFGLAPASYVKRLRLDAARDLLGQGVSIARTSDAVGFMSEDGFRRAFARRFQVSPGDYRKRFRDEGRGQ